MKNNIMLKIVIIIQIMLIACSTQLFAQGGFDIGVEAGPGLTLIRGSSGFSKFNPTIGFTGGLTLQYNLSKSIAIKTGINFERKNGTNKVVLTDGWGNPIAENVNPSLSLQYLTIPLMGKLTFGENKRFYVNAGMYFGYFLKGTFVVEPYSNVPENVYDIAGEYNRLDTGLSAGIGKLFPVNESLSIIMEVRNNLGLYDIINYDKSARLNSTNLLLGVLYKLGKN